MGDPHYPRSDQEHSGSVHEPPILQEVGLLRPLPSDLSSQCRDAGLWSKSHNSVDRFCGSSKRRPSVELSCELGLGVGENPRRVCRICYRHFSSGRALGGHMRVHGPLFQSAGTKRKINPMEFVQGPSNGIHMDCSDSKGSELSLLSRNLSEEQGYIFEGIEEPIITSDSDCEAVDDAETSDPYLHQISGVEGSSEHRMSVASRTKHACMELDAADDAMTMASSKRNPLYTLRHNPKKNSRFVEEELSMGMFLAEQDAAAAHPLSKGSAFTSLERPRVCSVCGKSFWSWKALFGHMRCHPERQWRGITPPDDSFKTEERIRLVKRKMLFAESRLMESSDFELDSDAENEEFGREEAPYQIKKSSALFNAEQVPDHDSEDDDRFDENSKDAESFGDTLREDDGHRRWPTGKRSRRKYVEGKSEGVLHQADSSPGREEPALTSESGSVEETEQQHEETPNFLLMLVEAARTIEREAQVRQRQDLLQRPRYDFKHYGEGQQAVVAISSSKQPEAAAANAVGMANKYECSTCKKSFNSHQALGGHRASHRKMKGCFARNGVGDNIEEYNLIRDDLWQRHAYPYPSGDTDVKQQPKKEHECSICHRIFSTGQALGGHKRCHYIGEKATEAAASFTSSSNKHIISENGCFNRLDAEGGSPLDLNMPAPTEENGENADVSLRSLLFDDKLDEKSKQQSSEELTLAPWAARKDTIAGGQIQSSPWELGSSWTRGPAVAC